MLWPPARAQRSDIWQERPGTWLLKTGLGLTRYTGDMNEWGNLAHLRLGAAISVAAAYRFSYQLTARVEAQLYYIHGAQRDTHLAYNNLSFFSLNPDVWAGLQWDFWPVDHRYRAHVPYALAGIGVTYMTPMATYNGRSYSLAPLHTEGMVYNRLPLIFRYGLGLPLLMTDRYSIQVEGTYTHVQSDYLDDVSTIYPDRGSLEPLAASLSDRRPELGQLPNVAGAQRGNPGRNDGYLIVSGRLTVKLMTPKQRNYRRQFGR